MLIESADTYWIGIRARLGDDARVTRDNDRRRADDSVHGVLPRESAARPPTIGHVRFLRLATRDPTASSTDPNEPGDHLGTTRDVIFDTVHSVLLLSIVSSSGLIGTLYIPNHFF